MHLLIVRFLLSTWEPLMQRGLLQHGIDQVESF
jgi:hypothetical protein